MSTRLDLVLRQHPDHEEGIRLMTERDPSGNLKYLGWGAKMLAAGQALAPEIADVIELFHQFSGQWIRGNPRGHGRRTQVRPDLYSYRPQDLAHLRDLLLKMKRARDKKQRQRERLYRIEGAIEAAVVYDSPDLTVRHIQNKQAGAHYGLSTKWCVAMLQEGYFDDYAAQNATFFYFERKTPVGDEFDKVCLMVPRNEEAETWTEAFTALDRRVDMLWLARVYGPCVFDIFRAVHECSERYPGSAMSRVLAGTATAEQLQTVYATVIQGGTMGRYETESVLESIACNDATPWSILEEIRCRASVLVAAAAKRSSRSHARMMGRKGRANELARKLTAAIAIHPETPPDVRDRLVKELRRRRIPLDTIHQTKRRGPIGIAYGPDGIRITHRYRRRQTPSELRRRIGVYQRLVVRTKKTLDRAEKAEAKKKKANQ
jgi:hypothetical protein